MFFATRTDATVSIISNQLHEMITAADLEEITLRDLIPLPTVVTPKVVTIAEDLLLLPVATTMVLHHLPNRQF